MTTVADPAPEKGQGPGREMGLRVEPHPHGWHIHRVHLLPTVSMGKDLGRSGAKTCRHFPMFLAVTLVRHSAVRLKQERPVCAEAGGSSA